MALTRSQSLSPKKKKTASKGLSQSKSGLQQPKADRRPRQCRRCPGRPLLSTCEHRFRKRPPLVTPSDVDLQTHVDSSPSAAVAPAPMTPRPLVGNRDPILNVIDPILIEEDMQTGALVAGVNGPAPVAPPEMTGVVSPSSTPPATPNRCLDSDASTTVDATPTSSPTPSSTTPKVKRTQPSGANAKWGTVEGAGRGNDVWEVYRVRKLKPPIKGQAEATRKLERWTIDLMSRAEAISTRTGCWLYLAIQHPASKTPFSHFTSRKLCNDAPEDVEVIHKEVRHTMNNLTRAHKRRLFESEKEIQAAKDEANAATQRAERAEDELCRLKRLLVAQGVTLDDE
ncbi:hypothetical protein CC1G_02458 [Coprinopsis cinerea okayama7|uniref:Uncharacterized protein n=1 Tax=Coprinopsis cinerea (strain Okayama-7 / 130 / ATCC MYA-4618 / FGSC 9003) TaxID=240176 RepID=A8NBJ8_COPC7|nr:hypothetical protein CC1G_02458 [Coprinopsis cinerea okayama7\|eukprot:XP_001832196.1 hypothetical protein CC1G_02458 [Coprinopsis cinerea okayama7\